MVFAGKAWSIHSPYTLSGAADKKTYTTMTKAAAGCMKNKKWTAANKFSLNTKATLTAKTGHVAYVRHGSYVTVNNVLWPKFSGYKLSIQYGTTTYTSDSAAMKACASSTSCKGITKTAAKKYTLGSTTSMTKAKGQVAYIKGDEVASSSKYYWIKKSGYSLNTRLKSTK
eukprot:sb/3472233/